MKKSLRFKYVLKLEIKTSKKAWTVGFFPELRIYAFRTLFRQAVAFAIFEK